MSMLQVARKMFVTNIEFKIVDKVMVSPKDEDKKDGEPIDPNKKEGKMSFYLVLELVKPIEKVMGSLTEWDPEEQKRVPYVATDVEFIHVYESLIEKYEESFVDIGDDTWRYQGDMRLDVSRKFKVWLTDTPHSKLSFENKAAYKAQKSKELVRALRGAK